MTPKKNTVRTGIDAGLLKTIRYDFPGKEITVDVSTDEFTCICPWSGFPDFADLIIRYVPRKKCVELKSLKYYLQSYRNAGIVHESVVNTVLRDLVRRVKPKWMHVEARFRVRGGIRTTVIARYGRTPSF